MTSHRVHRYLWTIGCLVALTGLATSVLAQEPRAEIGVIAGAGFPDEDVSGENLFESVGPSFGARGLYMLSEDVGILVDGLYSIFETPVIRVPRVSAGGGFDEEDGANVLALRGGLEYLARAGKSWRWYVDATGGLMSLDGPFEDADFDRAFISGSLGLRKSLGIALLRLEVRGDQALGAEGLGGHTVANVHALASLSMGLGSIVADEDGDGVRDNVDDCPNTPLGARVDAQGCPLDADGDRVFDGLDSCPDTPRGATVDARGCPSDSDGDGVFDGIDRCPDTASGVPVDEQGCPRDSDGDGVTDDKDRCPDTPRGTAVDANGCPQAPRAAPIFEEGKKSLVLRGVNFKTNSAELTDDSRGVLDGVAASLKDWPEIRVEIGGHTDAVGNDAANQRLSERRAMSVKAYLIQAGVDAARLETKGYGETQPVADNGTDEGRAQNRRVELTRLD